MMCAVRFAVLNAFFSLGDHQIVRESDVVSNNLVCAAKCVQSLIIGVLFGEQWSERLFDARVQRGCDAVDDRLVLFVGHVFLR
jgi:hypothetical protein